MFFVMFYYNVLMMSTILFLMMSTVQFIIMFL